MTRTISRLVRSESFKETLTLNGQDVASPYLQALDERASGAGYDIDP